MSIFKSTFKQYIKDQLKIREEARNEQGRKQPKNIQYLNSKTGWIRLTSSVDVDPNSELSRKLGLKDNQLAKKYILQGGTLYEKNNQYALRRGLGSSGGAYGDKILGGPNENWKQGGREELGIRPMPGINSISVKSKSAYGSLREATVSLTCWSMSQLEELELLYMRPGYTLLLEWGWSLYLDNRGNLVTNPPKYINILDTQNNKLSKQDIYDNIFKQTEESSGNYDAMFGYIKNFTWSSRQDGGFDCTISIISIGEVIESLKLNYATTDIGLVLKNIDKIQSPNKTEIKEKYKLNKFEGTLLYIKQRLIEASKGSTQGTYVISLDEGRGSRLTTEYLSLNFTYPIDTFNANTNQSAKNIFIPLKFLINILNDNIIPSDVKNKSPYIRLSVNDINHNPLECFAHKKQISINPEVCLITPSSNDLRNGNGNLIVPDFLNNISKEYQYFIDDNRGVIGNIFLNIDNLISIITSLSENNNEGTVDLYSFLKELLSQIQKSIGNINNFEVHIDGSTDVVRIIDVQYLENRNNGISVQNVSILKVFGNDTTVRRYSMQSSIFPSMATMIAISAQASGGALGYNNGTYIKFNEGLINRIIPVIDENKTPESTNSDIISIGGSPVSLSKTRTINEFYSKEGTLAEYCKAINNPTKRNILKDKIPDLQNALHDIIYYEIDNEAELNNDAKYKGIMPLKLSITMDGISGIVIGEIFSIPEDRLPLGYKSSGGFKVGFIVTGISHEIQNNDWVTVIETQTCILKP